MRCSTRHRFLGIALTLAFLVPLAGSGCKSTDSSVDDDAASATYTVRGEIKAVSAENKEIQLHHEEMSEFVNARGKNTGMMAMVMPFHVTESVDITALAAGDKVEVTFGTHWKKKPTLRITKVTKLPPETQLAL